MINNRHILTLLSFLMCVPIAKAQKGFKVIRKAEIKFEKGHNRRALKLLDKADNMNYGWCGNAWGGAKRSINLLRSSIYIKQGDYQLARNSLDSIEWIYAKDDIDSIYFLTYQIQFGHDSVSNMIDIGLDSAIVVCPESLEWFYSAEIAEWSPNKAS